MKRFGPGGNFLVKVVHLQRLSSLTGRSGPTEIAVPFAEIFVSSPARHYMHTRVKMADGPDVSVYECSVCKLQTQALNFLLMHSCTQGSGTAVHLNFIFLLVFISF